MTVHLPRSLVSKHRVGHTVEVATAEDLAALPDPGSGSPTVYTLGNPGSGSYDVEFPDSENARPPFGHPERAAQFVRIGNVVHLVGTLGFSGANANLQIALTESALLPLIEVILGIVAYDGASYVPTSLWIPHALEGGTSAVEIQRQDLAPWANGDEVYLTGTYPAAY